jgi:hypothetical protein
MFWLPGCGIVQHGWSHLGGDRYVRYNYLVIDRINFIHG